MVARKLNRIKFKGINDKMLIFLLLFYFKLFKTVLYTNSKIKVYLSHKRFISIKGVIFKSLLLSTSDYKEYNYKVKIEIYLNY